MPVTVIDRSLHGSLLTDTVKDIASTLLTKCDLTDYNLTIVLTDDIEIKSLNRRYRSQHKPTNVLSFPLSENIGLLDEGLSFKELGDIVISLDTARKEAFFNNQTVIYKLSLLMTHGLLHILGYDHEASDSEAERMSKEETRLLHELNLCRRQKMTSLAINVDHIATIRQARGIAEPDPVAAAAICELAGAEGIVVHLREDRRHIQDRDVRLLKETVKTRLNLEMGAAEEIVLFALEIKPDMVTLVPEKREELTTEGGLDVISQKSKLAKTIERMEHVNIPVSLFIDPDIDQVKASLDIGATYVEIHTGCYADATNEDQQHNEFKLIQSTAAEAHQVGLRVNAGHGLNYLNTGPIAAIGTIEELSIGHAIISRAVFSGLEQAVLDMRSIVKNSVLL
ncbi:MAG: pyridoxine 5'-phosphate synthase [Desulfobacterales bacterium]|nr:pyridoxine 5'-phosphate synthase [Deltaproteobacteria bacterium]NNK94380.1 pyridoxine 5'-phosphate synthase [Desulfobacterales bacterium]